jgi:hypothetical protein
MLVDGKWVRVGQRPGPVMYARDHLRIERWTGSRSFGNRWRCWDVIKNIRPHVTLATTFHPTLKAAKAHGDRMLEKPHA